MAKRKKKMQKENVPDREKAERCKVWKCWKEKEEEGIGENIGVLKYLFQLGHSDSNKCLFYICLVYAIYIII